MWYHDKDEINHYLRDEIINGVHYRISVYVPYSNNNLRYYIGLSSGVKRSELDIFDDKKNKTKGSLSNLSKLYDIIMTFDEWFVNRFVVSDFQERFYCIGWTDKRRKKIYQRLLEKRGWRLTPFQGEYTLTKKVH